MGVYIERDFFGREIYTRSRFPVYRSGPAEVLEDFDINTRQLYPTGFAMNKDGERFIFRVDEGFTLLRIEIVNKWKTIVSHDMNQRKIGLFLNSVREQANSGSLEVPPQLLKAADNVFRDLLQGKDSRDK